MGPEEMSHHLPNCGEDSGYDGAYQKEKYAFHSRSVFTHSIATSKCSASRPSRAPEAFSVLSFGNHRAADPSAPSSRSHRRARRRSSRRVPRREERRNDQARHRSSDVDSRVSPCTKPRDDRFHGGYSRARTLQRSCSSLEKSALPTPRLRGLPEERGKACAGAKAGLEASI